MKLLKSSLLGSAAALAAVAGAQAADLPVKKAAPIEYVRVCSTYGAGFFYIPGTDTCLRLSGREVTDALLAREALHRALHRFFQRHDFLVTPTTPVTAWPFTQPGPTHIDGQPVSPRAHAAFTPLFNHAFVPACSVPCGLDGRGLPVGLQIVGPRWSDARVLALATLVERQCPLDFSLSRDPPGHADAGVAAAPA